MATATFASSMSCFECYYCDGNQMDYSDFYGLTNAMEFNSITTFDCRAKGIIDFVVLKQLCDDILSYCNAETDGRI